ncbi:hypothetical protein [Acanthopleuribacter pedis]|uniref:Uncharacterized protein n=1 Tax=Acanthopleuribacter pedis TaxID=442870 RepID=A0A8J7QDE7_9BACT|nr:hypothetical protein [Acanthopleuribacter pedis]MBO1319031.1 hypothetical protein [Acanthopleuribacter pedis]
MKCLSFMHRTTVVLLRMVSGVGLLVGTWLQANTDILVLTPEIPHFQLVVKGLVNELGEDCRIEVVSFDQYSAIERMGWMIEVYDPKLIVLLGNHTLKSYKKLLKIGPASMQLRPVIGLMAVFVDREMRTIRHGAGIHYEIQGLTILTNLRSMTQLPVRRVGVLYRRNLRPFFEDQQSQVRREKIELVGFEIPTKEKIAPKDLRRGLRHLTETEAVDTLWVLNDSELLTPRLIRKAWRPVLKRFQGPVVVGVDQLLRDSVALGHFAVVPDHLELGVQAADLVWEVRRQQWQIPENRFRAPISVEKILNYRNVGYSLLLRNGAELEVDYIVGENF